MKYLLILLIPFICAFDISGTVSGDNILDRMKVGLWEVDCGANSLVGVEFATPDYIFEDFPSGDYFVIPYTEQVTFLPSERVFTITDNESISGLDFISTIVEYLFTPEHTSVIVTDNHTTGIDFTAEMFGAVRDNSFELIKGE